MINDGWKVHQVEHYWSLAAETFFITNCQLFLSDRHGRVYFRKYIVYSDFDYIKGLWSKHYRTKFMWVFRTLVNEFSLNCQIWLYFSIQTIHLNHPMWKKCKCVSHFQAIWENNVYVTHCFISGNHVFLFPEGFPPISPKLYTQTLGMPLHI